MMRYFFCGIGGSGMLPLAMILKGQGAQVSGSDRSRDQGRLPEKFQWIAAQGIDLFAQDGSGVTAGLDAVVVSTAVESDIPDVKAAKERGVKIITRAELLASLFSRADIRVAVAGTSGKSTTTGMIGYVLHADGKNPTVMNGAVFRNFLSPETPYATALCGDPGLFVTEADESDGSIALYNPTIAVLNNISLDHKSMDELTALFSAFISKAAASVLNLDNDSVAALAPPGAMTYSLTPGKGRLSADEIVLRPDGLSCRITDNRSGAISILNLGITGRHNLSNALACIGTCLLLGLELAAICTHLSGFSGVKRRLEVIGTSTSGVTVIDDFAHNPDKIAATLETLREFPGRLRLVFQIHGYNPIRLMRAEFADAFSRYLRPDDQLYIPEVLYLGGTVDRSVTARDLVDDLVQKGVQARWHATRADITPDLLSHVASGDRVVVMGARDDTLSDFARDLLSRM